VDPVPNRWTIEREVARAGLAKPRRRLPAYVPRGVAYPGRVAAEPGTTHQVDVVGPRHLHGGVEFHALNLIDVGSHEPPPPRPAGRRPGRHVCIAGPHQVVHLQPQPAVRKP
jgi:hypothetical protein